MSKKITVEDIVTKYLIDNNYDGLFYDELECACTLDCLFPCGDSFNMDCIAGYKTECDCGEHDFHISETKGD